MKASMGQRCEDDPGGTELECPKSPEYEFLCSIILDTTGPLAACHPYLDPMNYYKYCVSDLCLLHISGPKVCKAVETYERACNLQGVIIPHWHSPNSCLSHDPCGEQECTDNEWCGQQRGVFGCFCDRTIDITSDPTYDYKLTCRGNKSTISFSRCLLFSNGWPSRYLHLNDPGCEGHVSHGRIVFNFDSGQRSCGSKLKVNTTHFTYSNTVHGAVGQDNGIISRNRTLAMEFSCSYPLTINLSLPLAKVVKSVVNMVLLAGTETVEAMMIMYSDPLYSKPFTEFPITLDLGDKVYIGIRVQGVDPDQFVLTLENCWTTPIRNSSSQTKWELITNQCPNSFSEVEIEESGVSPICRFKFSAFKFVGDVDDIYLHCQIQLCNAQTSSCSANCPVGRGNRKGRSTNQSEPLSIGPITQRENAEIISSGNQVFSTSLLLSAFFFIICVFL